VVTPAGALGELLELGGAEVVEVPLPITPAARVVLGAVPMTGWILRHPDEVDALDEERDSPGWTADTVTWTVGPDVTERAHSREWRHVVELPVGGDPAAVVATIRGTGRQSPGDE
jgi:hypothetical protein